MNFLRIRYFPEIAKDILRPNADLLNIQKKRLEKILKQASKLDFYREYNVDENHLDSFPIIDKDTIINSNYKLKDDSYKLVRRLSTSGSSGKSLNFYRTIFDKEKIHLYHYRSLLRHGYRFGDTIGMLRSYIPKDDKAPKIKFDALMNLLFFSAYHMTNENLYEYCKVINEKRLKVLMCYPSSAYILSLFVKRNSIELPYLKVIFTTSEKLLESWKLSIETAFPNIELIDNYGLNEFVNIFQSCKKCGGYHINEDFSKLELIPIEENRYYIVGTGFFNNASPFVRYNSKDIFRLDEIKESDCDYGSQVYIGEIEGRSTDFIFSEGKFLPGVNFYTLFYKFSNIVDQFQIIQESEYSIRVNIAARDNFDLSTDIKQIEDALRMRIGSNMDIDFHIVDEIERDKTTGKIKNIISSIKTD